MILEPADTIVSASFKNYMDASDLRQYTNQPPTKPKHQKAISLL